MGAPLFKGKRAFELLDETLQAYIRGLEERTAGQSGRSALLGKTEIGLLEDLRGRLGAFEDEGLNRRKLYDTLFDALPGVVLPDVNPVGFGMLEQSINYKLGSIFTGDHDRTLKEAERDAIARVFNVVAIDKSRQYGIPADVISWVGNVYNKLDRAFAETWQNAWIDAHGGIEGAPAVEDVQGLERFFPAPGSNRQPG